MTVSIHAPHAGRDSATTSQVPKHSCFNPRAPCGARPRFEVFLQRLNLFQSTRPMRGATSFRLDVCPVVHVSIHAPRVGRDHLDRNSVGRCGRFNPRAPCGARRPLRLYCGRGSCFNPRAPCGARRRFSQSYRFSAGFNPRAPCGARHYCPGDDFPTDIVSIHAPRVGRDAALFDGDAR